MAYIFCAVADQYIAVVTCVPDGSRVQQSSPMESECRVFHDREAAEQACAAMAAAISKRVLGRGDEITGMEGV